MRPLQTGPPTRRTVLRAGAGGVLLGLASGCSVNNPLSDEPTPARRAVRDLSPDVAVAVETVAAIRAVQDRVRATARRHPGLQARLQGLAEMHRAHLDVLVDAVPDRVDTGGSSTPPAVPGRRPKARAQVLAAERRLHDQLTAYAMQAESGPFARLLGACAASVSQHVAVLG